jgi:hypothetical protein
LRDNATFGRISRNISRRNRVNFFISIMLVTVVIASLGVYPIMAQIFGRTHDRPELGLSFAYPTSSGWSIKDGSQTVFLNASDASYLIQVSAVLVDLEEGNNPNSKIDGRDFILRFELEDIGTDYQILNEGSTSINGRDFYSMLIIPELIDVQKGRALYMVTGLIEGTVYVFRLYSLSEQTYSQTLPIFQQIITSAELTGANPDLLEQEGGGGVQGGQEFSPFA